MAIALLVLIVLILLFGAGVVKGWLANLLGVAIGVALTIALILTVVSLFGREAFLWLVVGGGGMLLLASIWARSEMDQR